MKLFKRLLGVAVCLLVIAVVVAAIALRPYWRMPPESPAELEAKLAAYRVVAQEMAARPPADRQALDVLSKEIGGSLNDFGAKAAKDACPAYDAALLAEVAALGEEARTYEAALRAIAADGVALRQEARLEADVPDFRPIRGLTRVVLAGAVQDFAEGRRARGLERLQLVAALTDGLYRTPQLIFFFIGVALERFIDEAVVQALPRFDAAERRAIGDLYAALPDPPTLLPTALATDIPGVIDTLGAARQGRASLNIVDSALARWDFLGLLSRALLTDGYLNRERRTFISLTSRDIEALRRWAESGGRGPFVSPIQPEIKHSLLVQTAWANLPKLAASAADGKSRRAAVLAALRKLDEATTPTFELPYDAKSKLVVTPEYGCIKKTDPGGAP